MANQVTVYPGGDVFSSIQEAINSIDKASEECWYQVVVSPGTYSERVMLKPWVYVVGGDYDADKVIITAHAPSQGAGTVVAASNSGVTACTIICECSKQMDKPVAVAADGVQDFKLTTCKIYTKQLQAAHFSSMSTVGVNFVNYEAPASQVVMSYCEVYQQCDATSTGPSMEAVTACNGSRLEMFDCRIHCVGATDYAGAVVAMGGHIVIHSSEISCPYMALDTETGSRGGDILAIGCKIEGGVGQNVTVVP